VWTQVLHTTRPRKLYIDEAWSLIEHPEGGRFLANLARRARKRYLALVTITQNPELFATDEWGSVVAANAATKVLKKQDRTSADAITSRFQLTAGERQRLLTFGKHEALFLAGGKRVVLHVEASPLEHQLATTDPRELASRVVQQPREQEDQRDQSDEQITQKLKPIRNGHDTVGTLNRQVLVEGKGGTMPS
jgi:hypothetical protein